MLTFLPKQTAENINKYYKLRNSWPRNMNTKQVQSDGKHYEGQKSIGFDPLGFHFLNQIFWSSSPW